MMSPRKPMSLHEQMLMQTAAPVSPGARAAGEIEDDDEVIITWETALEPGRQQRRLDEFIQARERRCLRIERTLDQFHRSFGFEVADVRRGDHEHTLPASVEVARRMMQDAAARAGWDGTVDVSVTATQLFVWLSRPQDGGVLQAAGLIVGSGALASFEELQEVADAVQRAVRGRIKTGAGGP